MKKAVFLIVALTLVLIEANENKLKIGIKKRVIMLKKKEILENAKNY